MITAIVICLLLATILAVLWPPPKHLSPGLFIAIAVILAMARFLP